MTHSEIVKKLIGPIQPAGDASVDPERLENLKAMCKVAEELLEEIAEVVNINKHDKQGTVRKAAQEAAVFMDFVKTHEWINA